MGLTNWKKDTHGTIRKSDVSVAKNYLDVHELDGLNRIVSMYLDYAETQASKGIVMYMKDWIIKLDAFLQFNEKEVLSHQGLISHEVAIALAEKEYEKFQIIQNKLFESDFDKLIQEHGLNVIDSK
jgi:hypothetical protein